MPYEASHDHYKCLLNDSMISLSQKIKCPFCNFEHDQICTAGGLPLEEGTVLGCSNCNETEVWIVVPDGLKEIRRPT